MEPLPSATIAWTHLLEVRRRVERGEPELGDRDRPSVPADDADVLALFAELAACPRARGHVVAHLGQSLDGRIATESGHSHYIGGQASLVHLHRLRALVDAVVVGVTTVLADAPRLTVRHVDGQNPVRVVLDPRGRLDPTASVVCDRLAPTVVVRAAGCTAALPAWIEVVHVGASREGRLPPAAILEALSTRGLSRILIEGGGRTVSAFVEAGVVDVLQLAVAPLLIGSGRPVLTLPPVRTLDAALRPPCRRFELDGDTLFELRLRP